MIELKSKRSTKADRYECGEGKTCQWIPIAAALIGAAGSMAAARMGNRQQQQSQQSNVPQWSPEQRQYLFGSEAWRPQMPMFNPFAMNYAGGLMGGYNPAFGPQQPMGMQGLLGALGGGGQQQGGMPWFMDPSATPSGGGMAGLLGYGQGMPPPTLMNSPFFGHGVFNPDRLHERPGAGLPMPQERQGQQEEPQQTALEEQIEAFRRQWGGGNRPGYTYQRPFANWWEDAAAGPPGLHHSQIGPHRRQGEAIIRGFHGRNINDLTEEERAFLLGGGV